MGLRDEVEASNRRFGEVLAAGDRAALAELYEPDAVFASPGAGPVEGNEAIAAMVLAEPGQTVSLEFRSDHCWEVDGRVVDVGRAGAPGDRDQFA